MIPRGADAVAMVEHTDVGCSARVSDPAARLTAGLPVVPGDLRSSGGARSETGPNILLVRRALTAGANISFAATDIAAGECVLHAGTALTSRETGVLAAVGVSQVSVWRKPRVVILSTGDEIIAPGEPMQPGKVYNSNARILADAVHELGGEPVALGIVPDDAA